MEKLGGPGVKNRRVRREGGASEAMSRTAEPPILSFWFLAE